jgi:hypothetical protein
MEELDQLELAIIELLQGIGELDQLELTIDELLQGMYGMEELEPFQYLRLSARM